MLSEEQVEIISDAIKPLFQYLENQIIQDIAKRIERAEKYTRTVEKKVESMKRLGYSPAKMRSRVMKVLMADEEFQKIIEENTMEYKKECKKIMKKAQKSTDTLVKELAQSAANMSFEDDVTIWEEHGKKLQDDSYLKDLVEAICEQTDGVMKNLTNTTAVGFHTKSGVKKLPDVYRNELDKALIKICSGTYSSTEVINEAIHNLAESGLRSIDYKRGRSMQIDTAAKVAVRTAVNQIQAKVQDENIKRTGENLVYVSCHWGARDKGEGVENHAKWQGKVYFIREREYAEEAERIGQKTIEDIWECTGYSPDGSKTDNPLGLHGYNCRHQHHVWFEGLSSKPEEPQEPGPYDIDGKTYTYYDMTQKMRQMERKVRALRREREALKALEQPVDVLDASISEKTREYTEFCEKYNLKPRTENLRVEPNSSDVKYTKAWKEFEKHAKQEKAKKLEKKVEFDRILSKEEVIDKAKMMAEMKEYESVTNFQEVRAVTNKILGYDEKPMVVHAEEFEKLSEEREKLYRGVHSGNGKTAEEIANEFKYGTLWTGNRGGKLAGNGVYFTKTEEIAEKIDYKGIDGVIIEAVMVDDARLVNYMDIALEFEQIGIFRMRGVTEAYLNIIRDLGQYAALKGYDAIDMNGFNGHDYIVLLNRKKVIVKE